jgi:hypothetical protein
MGAHLHGERGLNTQQPVETNNLESLYIVLPSWSSNIGWEILEGRFEGRPRFAAPAYQAIASYGVGVAKWRRGGEGSLGLMFVTPTDPNTVDCRVQIGEEMKWGSAYKILKRALENKNRISQKHVSKVICTCYVLCFIRFFPCNHGTTRLPLFILINLIAVKFFGQSPLWEGAPAGPNRRSFPSINRTSALVTVPMTWKTWG